MPWVRFDDQATIHRKLTGLSDAAFRLHFSAIFWCARNLTDGSVPEEDLDDVCARVRTPTRFVSELLKRGLWHEAGNECDSPDCPAHPDNAVTNGVTPGWVIHDYLEYQPSKERVMQERESNAERQRKWREKQKPKVRGKKPRNAVSNGTSHGVSNAAPTRPDPSRRDGGSVDRSSSGSRRANDDDDLDKLNEHIEGRIIELLVELTGRTVDRLWASKVRREILDGRQVDNPLRYVAASIRGEPARYLPVAVPGDQAGAAVIAAVRTANRDQTATAAERGLAEARAALRKKP